MRYRGLALSGRAGSGKSTLARLLLEELDDFGIDAVIVSFGDALKRQVYDYFRLTKDSPGGRSRLVSYGEQKRNEDPLYWVNHFALDARRCWGLGRVVICDDLRFLSELGWCHAAGMETCRLEVPAHICAQRIAQPPDPLSPGECELIPWSGWTHRYDDFDGSLSLEAVARQLAAHVRESVLAHAAA